MAVFECQVVLVRAVELSVVSLTNIEPFDIVSFLHFRLWAIKLTNRSES